MSYLLPLPGFARDLGRSQWGVTRRRDHWVPSEISLAYFDALAAPSKKLVWFEKSGHEPFMDEPAKFNAAMVALVRPVLTKETVASTRFEEAPAGP